ncbi:MAG: hypothetical protein JJU24_02610 [Natronohydrobacter sp.]|nr:hypothetical protein [Natronohydrobacter sp.]
MKSVKETLDDSKNAEFFKNQTVCINSKDRPRGLHANEVHRVTINGVTIPMKVQSRDSKIGEVRLFDSALRKFGVSSGDEVSVVIEQGSRDDEIEWARNTRGNVELRLTIALVDEAARLTHEIKTTGDTSLRKIEQTHRKVLDNLEETRRLEANAKRHRLWGFLLGAIGGAIGVGFGLISWAYEPSDLMAFWPF